MKQTRHFLVLFAVGLALLAGCNKKESSYMTEVSGPPSVPATPVQTERPPASRRDAHTDIPDLSGAKIVVPETVQGKWKAVKLMLQDKKTNEITEHAVNLGEEWTIPDSQIKVKIKEFLPDLIIQGTTFTSVSNELKNPAVRVSISENGKELFTGWLFSLFPTMHPFQHERFALTLKDVVSA